MPHRVLVALPRVTSSVLALLLSAVVVAGGGQPVGSGGGGATPSLGMAEPLQLVSAKSRKRVKRALRVARAQIGDRYRYGAEGPDRFDCSGLVYYATHRAGFTGVPRTSADQGRYMRHIKRARLRRGDFVFFTGSAGVYHVGLYVGRRDGARAVLHAPKPGTRVRVEEVWTDSWFAATLRR